MALIKDIDKGSKNPWYVVRRKDLDQLILNIQAWATTSGFGGGGIKTVGVAASDETTDLTVGLAKITFRMPYAMTLTEVRASVNIAPRDADKITVNINQGGTSVLSTLLTIDVTEKTSEAIGTVPAVISTSALTDDAEITIDIDQVGNTVAGTGLKIWLIGT